MNKQKEIRDYKRQISQPQPGAVTDYLFTLAGPVMPAPRMVKGSQYVNQRAAAYLEIKHALGYQYRQQMILNDWPILPFETPLYIAFDLVIPHRTVDKRGLHYCDWDNLTKAIQDAGNGIIFWDDMYIDQCLGFRRRLGNDWETKVRVGVLKDPAT